MRPHLQRVGKTYIQGSHTLTGKEVRDLTRLGVEELGGEERLVFIGEKILCTRLQADSRQAHLRGLLDKFSDDVRKHFEEEPFFRKSTCIGMDRPGSRGIYTRFLIQEKLSPTGLQLEGKDQDGELLLKAVISIALK